MAFNWKQQIKRIPIIGPIAQKIQRAISPSDDLQFKNSKQYWRDRYIRGGNSGAGSYKHLAEFKAEIINEFVNKHDIESVGEFGCGDGNQLAYAEYPSYKGFDISPNAIKRCEELFAGDKTKSFATVEAYQGETFDLVLSLDVIYHLIEDEVYQQYMNQLFQASRRWVIIYSSDFESPKDGMSPHVKPRKFSAWVTKHYPQYQLYKKIPNRYPYSAERSDETSFADFFIYKKLINIAYE